MSDASGFRSLLIVEVVVLTGYGGTAAALEAVRSGAAECLTRPAAVRKIDFRGPAVQPNRHCGFEPPSRLEERLMRAGSLD